MKMPGRLPSEVSPSMIFSPWGAEGSGFLSDDIVLQEFVDMHHPDGLMLFINDGDSGYELFTAGAVVSFYTSTLTR